MTKYPTRTIKLSVPGTSGILDARLDIPDKHEPLAYLIMCHCFTCTKETITTSRTSRGLAQNGYAVLRFDFTGLGGSEGSFADTNFTSMVDDVIHTTRYLEQHYQPATAMLGHSMGGTAVLAASSKLPLCKTIITIASPSKPSHVLHHFGKAMPTLESGFDAEITVAGIQYPVKPQFIRDVRQYDMNKQMQAYNKPVMAIRAGKDTLVHPQDAEDILAYTSGEHSLLDIEHADHLFSDRTDVDYMILQISNWLNHHALE